MQPHREVIESQRTTFAAAAHYEIVKTTVICGQSSPPATLQMARLERKCVGEGRATILIA